MCPTIGKRRMYGGPGMAIDDLPLPIVTFLNAIGVPWPYLNEDTASGLMSSTPARKGLTL